MGNLLKAEMYKLTKDRSFWVLALILLALGVLYPLTMQSSQGMSGTDFYRGHILSINTQIVNLFPAILAGFFIASEYSMGTMKSMAASGNSRFRIYFAKLTVFSIGSIIIMLILPVFMMASSSLYMDFASGLDWVFYFQSAGLIALYAAAFASFMMLCSTLLTDSGKAIGFLILFLALAESLLQFISSKIQFLEPFITRTVFMTQGYILTVDQVKWDSDDWLKFIIVPIVTFLVFGVLGGLIFKKQEIK